LVVTGTMEFYDFPIILGIYIFPNWLIFFRGVGQPPTSDVGCELNIFLGLVPEIHRGLPRNFTKVKNLFWGWFWQTYQLAYFSLIKHRKTIGKP
jgi:hypothetical protein